MLIYILSVYIIQLYFHMLNACIFGDVYVVYILFSYIHILVYIYTYLRVHAHNHIAYNMLLLMFNSK